MDIEAITAYKAEHLGDGVSLEKAAQHFHYAPSYFSRQFKKITGVTFRKYLESMRVQASMRKLLAEEGNVTHIAGQVGYDYSSNFSKIFRKRTGSRAKGYKSSANLSYRVLKDFVKTKKSLHYHRFKDILTNNQVKINLIYSKGHQPDLVFVGLFPDPLPNQVPITAIATAKTKAIYLNQIPAGSYYLLACDLAANTNFFSAFIMLDNYRSRHGDPFIFDEDSSYVVNLLMERPQPHHPLITANLPKLVMDSLLKKSK